MPPIVRALHRRNTGLVAVVFYALGAFNITAFGEAPWLLLLCALVGFTASSHLDVLALEEKDKP